MTQEEYLNLLKSSEAFKGLEADFQKIIVNAKGAEKIRYEEIFTSERDAILEAKQELMEKNAEVMKKFDTDKKKAKKDFMHVTETKVRKNEEKEAEDLLNSL